MANALDSVLCIMINLFHESLAISSAELSLTSARKTSRLLVITLLLLLARSMLCVALIVLWKDVILTVMTSVCLSVCHTPCSSVFKRLSQTKRRSCCGLPTG